MGWRFRKSFKVAPGVRLNVTDRGVRPSVSIPGTGLRYQFGEGKARNSSPAPTEAPRRGVEFPPPPPSSGTGVDGTRVVLVVAAFVVAAFVYM